MRLTLIGALLLAIGGLLVSDSVWTLPLVIAGGFMVAIAWVGHRLDGRFIIEWGEAGTELAFRATVKTAQPADELGPLGSARSARLVLEPRSAPEAAPVIDGEAQTVEIDVAELNALVAAAGQRVADFKAAGDSPHDIEIRRIDGVPSEASH